MDSFSSQSNLDGSAAEFVPSEELRQKMYKRASMMQLKVMLEPIFGGDRSNFQAQLLKVKEVSLMNNVNAPHLIGEVLSDVLSSAPERTTTGFRFAKELRAVLPGPIGKQFEGGLTDGLKELTTGLLSSAALENLEKMESMPTSCEESGDTPRRIDPTVNNRLFGLIKTLNLLITRFNLGESLDESVCIPPAQPCVDLCKLVSAACQLQLASHRSVPVDSNSSQPDADEFSVFSLRNWCGLLYQLFDTFTQSLPFFHCLLRDMNSHVLNGSWTKSATTHVNSATAISSMNGSVSFECSAQLSSLMSAIITSMRDLLLDEKLPVKLLRTAVLDILLTSTGQFLPSQPTEAFPEWAHSNEGSGVGSSLVESDEMDMYKCYEEFLRETKQIPS